MLTAANLTFRDYLDTLRRHRLLIVVVAIAAVVVGSVPAALEDPVYRSTATVQVRPETSQSPFEEPQSVNELTRSRELSTDVELIQSGEMRSLVSDRLGPDAGRFFGVSARVVEFSEIISLSVTAPTPGAAADAANAYAEVFVEERRAVAVDALVTQADELRNRVQEATKQIAAIDVRLGDPALDALTAENLRLERSALAAQVLQFTGRADELDVEAALREGGTRIVSRAGINVNPISPEPLRSAVIAAVIGLLTAIGLAVVLDTLQDRLTGAEDLERIDPNIPVLASVPHIEGEVVGTLGPGAAMEAYRYLRTSVRFVAADTPTRSITVSSATEDEGKTTTAVNLARVVAESGARVVLVDADLRKPSVHKQLGLDNGVGLGDVLTGSVSFSDAVTYVEDGMAVVTAGPPSAVAPELLGRAEFAKLVETVSEQCDLLVIDVPPILPVADPLVVAEVTDCLMVVARVGRVRRREIRESLRRLREAHIRVVGFVANDAAARDGYGDYIEHAATSS